MNDWNKVEKNKSTAHQDIQMIYIKMCLFILAAVAYFYFIIMGWTI